MPKSRTVELKKLDKQTMEITIVGDSALIPHRWSDKAKQQMLNKQMKKVSVKEPKDPEEQYQQAMYRLDDGSYGFPADGVKMAAVRGAKALSIVMTDARGAFFIIGEYSKKENRDLVRIEGKPEMREDMVRCETGTADIRYRGQFFPWKMKVKVEYNAAVLSAEQIVNMLQSGGFGTGLGDWRPERNGMFGRFHVATK